MSNPLALLPLALAAAGGTVDQFEAQQLVAAGLTLLQRSAPLVRALRGHRSAILVPASPAFVTALAASDGRGAVLLDPRATPPEIAAQCTDAGVGAIFTVGSLAPRVPAGLTTVLLDDAPWSARVVAGGVVRNVDLGSHHGLSLEGEADVAGRDEEVAVARTVDQAGLPTIARFSHRALLAAARDAMRAAPLTETDHLLALLPWAHPFGLTMAATAPLLAGARVSTSAPLDSHAGLSRLAGDLTVIVGSAATYGELLAALEDERGRHRFGKLRLCICHGAVPPEELRNRWVETTGVAVRGGDWSAGEEGGVRLLDPAAER